MEMRFVKNEDLKELKEIWKLCFGDEDSFIEYYFQSRDWMKETAVLANGRRVASMLTMIPVHMVGKDGEKHRASMLYAIATHPDFQKRGYAHRLIEFSNEYLLSQQVFITLLVPGGEDLFRFYGKRGYQNGFFIREAVLRREEIGALAAGAPPVTIRPAEPGEYNRIRKILLTGRPRLDYRDEEISFEKQLARMYGTDLYSIEINGSVKGCSYAEKISEEKVTVKELLIPEQYLTAALKQLSELLGAEKYIVRTPSYSGESLGGTVRPFGMIRFNGIKDKRVDEASIFNTDSYLGIAYD